MAEITKRNAPRDVFLHLLAMVTLYWAAGSFIALLFQYINYFFPDPVFPEYYMEPLRFAIASLTVVFPVFIFVSRFLENYYKKEPQAKEMRLRRWLLYFTIFAASLLIIGDLVSTILNFLEGNLTSRFVLKALSILLVAAAVLSYYLNEVRQAPFLKNKKAFVWAVCAVVFIGVVGAFFIVGSPKYAREMQLDQQRINDLQTIQYEIINYWQRKQKLPATLADLTDNISGFVAPVDPETKSPYEYIIKDESGLSFELCAVFNKTFNSKVQPAIHPYYNWDHTAGRVCFQRNIDRQLYPPLIK